MSRFPLALGLVVLLRTVCCGQTVNLDYDDVLAEVTEDLAVAEEVSLLEAARTDAQDAPDNDPFTIRSRHFIFGMPRLTDDRYRVSETDSGVSLLVREGFVIMYLDAMRCPLWVAQRWTRDECMEDQDRIPSLDRDWREDADLPMSAHIGTSYAGNDTRLDRGHMARHAMNRAWGFDASIAGCLMSNSAPQHRSINRGAGWRDLEDAIRDIVKDEEPEPDIDVVWTFSGTLFRDSNNPPEEDAAEDMARVGRITTGFAVPYATYKIVAWFEDNGFFYARGYVYEQPYTIEPNGDLAFDLPDQDRPVTEFLAPIDEIEERAGVDFFPMLRNNIEDLIERKRYTTMWDRD